MKVKRKVFVLAGFVLLFLIGFTLKVNIAADGEIEVIKYVEEGKVSLVQLITHKNVSEITLEAYNENNQMSHFMVLENYMISKKMGLNKNSFYITNRVAGLDDIHELYLINGGNIRIPLTIQEVQQVTETAKTFEAVENKSNKGSGDTLKIMSYNIHHGRNLFGRYSLDEIVEVIRNSDADIIGLQELDSGVVRSRFHDQIKYLSERLSMEYAYGYNHNILGGKYGNGILSKYPIESYDNLYLPSGREQRGLLDATININGKHLNFLVTHLGLNQQERDKQVKSISKYLDTLTNPVVLVGDFNTTPKSEEIQHLSRRLMDTAYIFNKDDEPTFDLSVLSGRIDYIFLDLNFNLQDYEVIKSRASDHYPITATFELE